MKKTTLVMLLFFGMSLTAMQAFAQKDKSQRPSPPAQVTAKVGDTQVTIDYSQPAKKGRTIFGELVPYGQVWRTGANEATWIEVSNDVTVQGETLKAGKYAIFTIPGEKEWTIIFNSKWDQWGNYSYKESEDVLRVKAPAGKTDATERFTITLDDSGKVTMAWDETKVEFTVK